VEAGNALWAARRPLLARKAHAPARIAYIDGWIDERRLDGCVQLIETEDPTLFDGWIAKWNDLVEFEIVPVVSSDEEARRVDHPVSLKPA
jgi:Protein of unknown function (DUF3303)